MTPNLAEPLGGGGTTNYVPVWTSNTNLGNSTIYETGGNVGIGTTAPTSTLTVAGSVSAKSVTAFAYQFDGDNALSTVKNNLFVGPGAGNQHEPNVVANTFVGVDMGNSSRCADETTARHLPLLTRVLIAEEVAEIYPDLVAYEPDGKPYTEKY